MKPKYIIPCVCIDHEPNVSDSVRFGMPQLVVVQSAFPNEQFYSAFCPNCGRGNKWAENKTAHKALKEWNDVQETCWHMELFDISGRVKADTPEWRIDLYNKYVLKRNKGE